MSRPQTANPAPSTIRVRRHRTRKALKARFSNLLYSVDDNQMFTLSEILESLILEQIAYPSE